MINNQFFFLKREWKRVTYDKKKKDKWLG